MEPKPERKPKLIIPPGWRNVTSQRLGTMVTIVGAPGKPDGDADKKETARTGRADRVV